MALRKPLVLNSGQIEQLQSGDTLDAPVTSIDVEVMTNGEAGAITIGIPVYISAADTVKKAKADAVGTSDVIGLVRTASIAASVTGDIQVGGVLSSADWTAVVGGVTLTSGSIYYLSQATAGQLTTTAPSTGFIVQVGIATSTTELLLDVKQRVKL